MHPGSARPQQVFFSVALSAAALALLHPSVHWPAQPASLTADYLRPPAAPAVQAAPAPRALASYRARVRPSLPVPSPSRSVPAPRVSNDLVAAEPISSPTPTAAPAQPAQAAPPAPAATPYPSYSSPPPQSAETGSTSSFQACVIARESGGNPQVMNSSGHYGLYQFSASTWAAYGGNPADFGNASVAEQNQVFDNAIAAGGQSNWAPYDGC
jgi:soluble lytic murein transglycosylase-like protein